MKNEPVRCGCGGEAELIECEPDYENSYLYTFWVECKDCGIETVRFHDETEAIEAWNKAMGNRMELQTVKERTAKVKKRFMLVTGGMGDTLPLCECGFIVSDKWTYCPSCGCRLEWNERR